MKATFPFFPILALIFITLKLTGFIAWSWVWVLAPLWMPLGVVLAVMLVMLVVMGVAAAASSAFD